MAAWGIFASLVPALVGMAVILFPALGDVLGMSYMAPMFIDEVGLGIWLLFKRLRTPIENWH